MSDETPVLGDRFDEGFLYASRVHRSQGRKQGKDSSEAKIPYLCHLMAVAATVLEDGGDEDMAIAALLHDAAEDQGGHERLEDIRRHFGDRVAGIVEECSDTLEDPKPDWGQRKRDYIAHLRGPASADALRVSLADKLHNCRAIIRDHRRVADRVWERFGHGRDDQLWYYGELAKAYGERLPGDVRQREFANAVDEMHREVLGNV